MKEKVINFFKENLIFIIVIIAIILVRLFIVTPVRVSGTSMYPTLKNGDIMLLNKTAKKKIKRYDVVVISKKFKGEELIKRVIGIPGDTVESKDGKIYVNDKAIDDKFAHGITNNFDKISLSKEKNEYFVLGDNREVSLDSRILGKVDGKYIKGTSNLRLLPFSKIGNTLKK